MLGIAISLSCLGGLLLQEANASLIHRYDFNGDFSDSLGGPSLDVSGPASLIPPNGAFDFSAAQGLSLSSPGVSNEYSILIDFSFTFTSSPPSGYRKILDFKNLGSDYGLYSHNDFLEFYGAADVTRIPLPPAPPASVVKSDDRIRLVVTRAVGNTFSAYVDGVLNFSFPDFNSLNNSTLAVLEGPANIIRFFQDDAADGTRTEEDSGTVARIEIYDHVLSAAEVLALGAAPNSDTVSAVPEADSWLIWLVGVLGAFAAWEIKQRRFLRPAHILAYRQAGRF